MPICCFIDGFGEFSEYLSLKTFIFGVHFARCTW